MVLIGDAWFRVATLIPTAQVVCVMSDESPDQWPWNPVAVSEQWQRASEQAMERQLELFQEVLSGGRIDGGGDLSRLSRFGMGAATFKTRVQSGGRISIPDAEREALDIEEGDIVQTIVVPIKRDRDHEED